MPARRLRSPHVIGIPVGFLRDWEQGRRATDAAAQPYLHIVGSLP
jgi:DNA-binding transcriptional regulator YiaG